MYNIKIIINSNINGTIALNHLLDSLKILDDFNNFEIIICIGGYFENTDYQIVEDKNIKIIKCYYNSIDLTAFITILELYNENNNFYFFYMHDTCKVGKMFLKTLINLNLNNVSTLRLNKAYSMNIGIYTLKILYDNTQYLLSNKNTKESLLQEYKIKSIKNEDYIFKSDKNNKLFNNKQLTYTLPATDYYNTGTLRIVEYYEGPDLYKIKANYIVKEKYILNN